MIVPALASGVKQLGDSLVLPVLRRQIPEQVGSQHFETRTVANMKPANIWTKFRTTGYLTHEFLAVFVFHFPKIHCILLFITFILLILVFLINKFH